MVITSTPLRVSFFGGGTIKRTLTQKITNAALDEIYEAGLRAGALGGKLLGAGGGGFMVFFVPPERRKALRERLKNLLCIPFSFSARGSHIVFYEPEELYDQALAYERSTIYSQNADREHMNEVAGSTAGL